MPNEQLPQPPIDPESLRAQAVQAHVAGNLSVASQLRQEALSHMSPADPRFPGVEATLAFSKRTTPASFTEFDALRRVAARAVNATKDRLDRSGSLGCDTDILSKELPATLLHYGVLVGGLAVRTELGQEPQAHLPMEEFGNAITTAHTLSEAMADWGVIHQTQINLARRRAAMLGLTGKPVRGLLAAAGAVLKAPLSESPYFTDNATDELSRAERLSAKYKAVKGGIAAGVISAANLPGVRSMGGRKASLKLFAAMEGMTWVLTVPNEPTPQHPSDPQA